MTTSSPYPPMPGISSPTGHGLSCPSPHEIGQQSVTITEDWYKSLSRQLLALDEEAAGPALLALRAMEKKLCLDREAIWRLQVSDDRLGEFLIALTRSGSEP